MKAQFWSIDVIFAIIIFTGAMIALSIVWLNVNNQFSASYGYNIGSMQAQLNSLIVRMQSTGFPQNWNSQVTITNPSTWTNVTVGLGSQSGGSISTEKLMTLVSMSDSNYQATKQPLGVAYDYYITLSSPYGYNITVGKNPLTNNALAIQTATVPVVLDNGQPASVQVMVWTNTTFGVG